MAFDELRNGDMPEEQAGQVYLDPLWADAFQEQTAAALEMQWITLPISAAQPPAHSVGAGSAVWSTTAIGQRHWLITPDVANEVPLTMDVPGSQGFRNRAEILKARVFVGGNFSSANFGILYALSYGTPAAPAGQVAFADIYAGAGPGAGSVAVHTADYSASPKVLSDDTDYYFRAKTILSSTGTVELYGVQLLVRYPLTPNP